MTLNRRSKDWVSARGETVVDGAPATCRLLDDLHQALGEPDSESGADWIATDWGLHYLHYNSGRGSSWPWSQVAGVALAHRGLVFSRVRVVAGDADMTWSLGRKAAGSLVTIAAAQAS